MSDKLLAKIQEHLENLSKLKKDIHFYQSKSQLFAQFKNLSMNSSTLKRRISEPDEESEITKRRKIEAVREYKIDNVVKAIYYPEKNEVHLEHMNKLIKFSYQDFMEFALILADINEGWCDDTFNIGDNIHMEHWHEEERNEITIYDRKNKILIGWDEEELLDLLLEHRYNIYDFFCELKQ